MAEAEKLVVNLDDDHENPALEAGVDVELGENKPAATRPLTSEELAQVQTEAGTLPATPEQVTVVPGALDPSVIDAESRPAR